jgi:hypothetical protein
MKKTMVTNTAFLLNAWFQKDTTMWLDVRKYIEKLHNAHIDKNKCCFVKVTFELDDTK